MSHPSPGFPRHSLFVSDRNISLVLPLFPMTATATPGLGNLRSRADWRSVEELYSQFTSIIAKKERVPPEVAGALATSLGRVLAFYEDNEQLFLADLTDLWSEIDKVSGSAPDRFRTLYFDSRLNDHPEYKFPPDPDIRRRPRPFESSVETVRRLIDVNNLRNALAGMESAAILGGSVSYGRFYNVIGAAPEFGSKPSDTDVLLVLQQYSELDDVISRLRSLQGVDQESFEALAHRAELFKAIRSNYGHCIFSHKLKFWERDDDPVLAGKGIPSRYAMSLHIFSLEEFDYLTLKDIPILQPEADEKVFQREIHDFRESTSPKGAYDKKSFSGIPLGKHDLNPMQVVGGFVTTVQVCLIQDERFCPGLHQNLILPQFEKRWESNSVRIYLRMLTFRWKILERLLKERTLRPFEKQEISLCHVRYFVFSPHIQRRADRDGHV